MTGLRVRGWCPPLAALGPYGRRRVRRKRERRCVALSPRGSEAAVPAAARSMRAHVPCNERRQLLKAGRGKACRGGGRAHAGWVHACFDSCNWSA
mmetsp:Transcript_14806/g.51603  ORF Transcript_14806/g.51603 Transcript_14806/m.51603 type:complete len:95 (-) Transcript_14806:28-312(-)